MNRQEFFRKTRAILILMTFLFVMVAIVSCGTLDKVRTIPFPNDIDKMELLGLEVHKTPVYDLPYSIDRENGVDQPLEFWGEILDDRWQEFSDCIKRELGFYPSLEIVQSIRIIVVPQGKFECDYHKGRCSGEYDTSLNAIYVSRKDFNKDGFVPMLSHEWGHALSRPNGEQIYKSDHSNKTDAVRTCVPYL